MSFLLASVAFFTLAVIRLYLVLPNNHAAEGSRENLPNASNTCSLAVFLGSGGHTHEAIALLAALDFQRYSPRTYIVSEGDNLSSQKAVALEFSMNTGETTPLSENSTFRILTIPRARRVHQSLFTTPGTVLRSLLTCLYYVTLSPILSRKGLQSTFADVLLLNGPGTCLVLCIAVYVNRILGLKAPKIIYIESFARVRKLSLSGKLLRPLVDRFIVQWPQLASSPEAGEYYGWLV
ncbi:glycosyltransferase family 1 protein [Cyathus striatus]|nr:glycosyltransferase family 1 protein [Cyathus striatus]